MITKAKLKKRYFISCPHSLIYTPQWEDRCIFCTLYTIETALALVNVDLHIVEPSGHSVSLTFLELSVALHTAGQAGSPLRNTLFP